WGVVTNLLPLLVLLIGVVTVIDGGYRGGALAILASAGLRGLGGKLAARGEDLTPYAATVGEVRARSFSRARSARVPLRQLYIMPTGKMPEANAFAMSGGNVLLTDHLVRNLNRRQMDAIVAHELAHLKLHHPGWLLTIFLAAVLLPMLVGPNVLPGL